MLGPISRQSQLTVHVYTYSNPQQEQQRIHRAAFARHGRLKITAIIDIESFMQICFDQSVDAGL